MLIQNMNNKIVEPKQMRTKNWMCIECNKIVLSKDRKNHLNRVHYPNVENYLITQSDLKYGFIGVD